MPTDAARRRHLGDSYEDRLRAIATAITAADPLAPSPDAPIVVGMRHAYAWEGRKLVAAAVEQAPRARRGFALVGLYSPKKPENIGSALRAAACFGAAGVVIERLRFAQSILKRKMSTDTGDFWKHLPLSFLPLFDAAPMGCETVAVEIAAGAESLFWFQHPERALYIFGPEDGSIPAAVLSDVDRKVAIPTLRCINLAAAVNIVLFDRLCKQAGGLPGA